MQDVVQDTILTCLAKLVPPSNAFDQVVHIAQQRGDSVDKLVHMLPGACCCCRNAYFSV